MTQQQTQQRMTVHDAARKLGISEDAVRMRVKRSTLEADREDGRLYVLLDPDPTLDPTADQNGSSAAKLERALTAELLEELRSRVSYLEGVISTRDEEIRRRDVIISHLTQRIPAIEAAESPESPVPSEPPTEAGEAPREEGAQEAREPRSWWRLLFGAG